MAVNLTVKPQLIQPVYNPIYLKTSSNKTNEEAYSFVFDLYVDGDFISRDRLLPRPATTEAIYSPARMLESYLSFDKTHNIVGTTASTNCILYYEINGCEEYITPWNFDEISRDTISGTSFMMLSSQTVVHPYNPGDTITISGTEDGFFDGIYEVYRVLDNKHLLLTADFLAASNLLRNPQFINTSIWQTNLNWNISGGTAISNNSNEGSLAQINVAQTGKTYESRVDIIYSNGDIKVALGSGSIHTITGVPSGVTYVTISNATSKNFELWPVSGKSAILESVYLYRSGGLTGTTNYTDGRKSVFCQSGNVLANPTLEYDLGQWTSFGPDGCAVTAGLVVTDKLQLVVPDSSCGSGSQTICNTGTTLQPGAEYVVTFTVSNVNNPSNEYQAATPIVGGTFGTPFFGTGTTTQTIVCGTGTTFCMNMNMQDADTGGFGSHSMAISAVSVESDNIFTGYTFNGVVQYEEYPTFNYLDYMMTGSTSKFLTNQPATVKTKLNESGSIGFMNIQPFISGVTYYMIVGTTFNDGSTGLPLLFSIPQMTGITKTTDELILEFGAYPINLNVLSQQVYATDVITNNVASYQLFLVIETTPGNFTQISEIKTFEIDYTCSKYEPVRFMFLNSLGQFDYFTATLLSRENININKTSFQKVLPYNYQIGDRGKSLISIDAQQNYVVTSNWIDEETCNWLMELFLSIEVYIINSDGTLTPIIIDNNSVENKKRVNDQLINYTFNYSKAVNKNTARG